MALPDLENIGDFDFKDCRQDPEPLQAPAPPAQPLQLVRTDEGVVPASAQLGREEARLRCNLCGDPVPVLAKDQFVRPLPGSEKHPSGTWYVDPVACSKCLVETVDMIEDVACEAIAADIPDDKVRNLVKRYALNRGIPLSQAMVELLISGLEVRGLRPH